VIAGQTATRAGDASFDLVGGLDDGPDNFLSRERAMRTCSLRQTTNWPQWRMMMIY
jgi:hypothetical protein